MKFKYVLALAAVTGGVLFALRRHQQRATAEADLWAEATDRVVRT